MRGPGNQRGTRGALDLREKPSFERKFRGGSFAGRRGGYRGKGGGRGTSKWPQQYYEYTPQFNDYAPQYKNGGQGAERGGGKWNSERKGLIDAGQEAQTNNRPLEAQYKARMPYEKLDHSKPKPRPFSGHVSRCDKAIAHIRYARKRNELGLQYLVTSKVWPMGRRVSYATNLYAKRLEGRFYKMLVDHVENEKKGPVSMFEGIQVPDALDTNSNEGDIDEMVAKCSSQF